MDSSTFVTQTLNIPGVQFTIEDNPLNQYDRYTYHFTLSMVGETDSRDPTIDQRLAVNPAATVPPDAPENAKPVRKIIIAQSGVTVGLNLVGVSIEDSVSSNLRYKNSVTTEILMTITEPYSINLVDQMFGASKDLGVANWRLAPLFLELEFKGYKEDGTLLSSSDFNIRRVWKILIVDLESTLTQVGTTYKIKAVSQNTQGFLDIYYQIPTTTKITLAPGSTATPSLQVPGTPPAAPGTTVKQFFEELGKQLTNYYFTQRTDNSQPRTPFLIYRFEIAEEIGKEPFNVGVFDNGRRMPFSNVTLVGRDMIIGRGISITSLLDDVIASTTLMAGPGRPWFLIDEDKGIVLIPRVECIVRNVGYDSLNNDYIRELVFVVSAKRSTRPVVTRELGQDIQRGVPSNPTGRQLDRLKYIVQNSLKKAYPYYYTGRNTEIINLNVVFQNMHVIPLPLVSSAARSPADQSQLPSIRSQITATQQDLQNSLANLQRLRTARAAVAPASPAFLRQIEDEETVQRALQADLDRLRREEARLLGIDNSLSLFDGTISERLRNINGINVNDIFNNDASERLRGQFDRADAANRATLARLRAREFVEDVLVANLDPGDYTYIADPRDIANTMARSLAPAANPIDETRRYYTTILAQIYDRSLNQLTEIEMDIRGDPYWFGKTNLERERELTALFLYEDLVRRGQPAAPPAAAPERRNLGTVPVAGQANYYDYDAHFLLIFRGGQIPEEDTGLQKLENSVWFTAVYQTITVTHKFENGTFTQKINAVRDGLINLNGLRPRPTP